MFVADATGIRVSRVNAFVRNTAPQYVLRAEQYTGTIRALAGYTCFEANTPVPGNCLWFATDANTLYPLLRRLEKQGYLTSEWNTDEARPRKFYRTSDAGTALADRLLAEWDAVARAIAKLSEEDAS